MVVVPTVIVSDMLNIEGEGQEIEIDSPLIKLITVEEL